MKTTITNEGKSKGRRGSKPSPRKTRTRVDRGSGQTKGARGGRPEGLPGPPPSPVEAPTSEAGTGTALRGEAQLPPMPGGAVRPNREGPEAAFQASLALGDQADSSASPAPVSELAPNTRQIVDRLRSLHDRDLKLSCKSRELARTRLTLAREQGDLLIQLKGQRPHGSWQAFVLKECGIKPRTARDYMALAEDWALAESLLASKRRPAAVLTIKWMLKAISQAKADLHVRPGSPRESSPKLPDSPVVPASHKGPAIAIADRPDPDGQDRTPLEPGRAGAEIPEPDGDPEVPAVADLPAPGPVAPRRVEATAILAAGRAEARSGVSEVCVDAAEPVGDEDSASPPALSVAPELAAIGSEEQLREHFLPPLTLLRQSYRASSPDPGRFRAMFTSSKPFREQYCRLLAAEHASEWADCDKCRGDGFDPCGKPCRTCASVGLVLATEAGLDADVD